MTDAVLDLDTLSADVDWIDPMAARAARDHVPEGEGRLAVLHEWLAGTQGAFPVREPSRVRCLAFGSAGETLTAVCAALDVGVREVQTDPAWTVAGALAAGAAVADEEVDAGTDLAVVAAPDDDAVAAVAVSVLTGAEPVALLPRGVGAIDSAEWIRRAEHLRDTRRRVAGLKDRPDELLAALGHPPLAAAAGFVARATARRTPLLLDGALALAAALLTYATQPRAERWWQVADTSTDPVTRKAAAALELTPVLGLGRATGDGLAGVLAVALVRAAALLGRTR